MQALLNDIQSHVKSTYDFSNPVSVENYRALVESAEITYTDPEGKACTETVELWHKAIQKALDENKNVWIPKLGKNIFISETILLHSGNHLKVDAEQRILLAPNSKVMMFRSDNVIDTGDKPSPLINPTTDIAIDGGIWDAMVYGRKIHNGNDHQEFDREASIVGGGAFSLFTNVKDVIVHNLTICNTTAYGVLVCNCLGMHIENMNFINCGRDGVHVNGGTSYIVIREMRGERLGDDLVALNAWDWRTSAMSFGTIQKALVENIHSIHNEFRLLPGRKTYPDGSTGECEVRDVIIRNIEGVYTYKLYAQPNCGNIADRSEIVGNITNVYFDNIVFPEISHTGYAGETIPVGGLFEISSDVTDIHFDNIKITSTYADFLKENMPIIKVGPLSYTWKRVSNDPKDWYDIMSPDDISTLKHAYMGDVTFTDCKLTEQECRKLICATHMTVNPDYPKTTPKGGNGYGIIEDVTFRKI